MHCLVLSLLAFRAILLGESENLENAFTPFSGGGLLANGVVF